jgi:thioredoxin 1
MDKQNAGAGSFERSYGQLIQIQKKRNGVMIMNEPLHVTDDAFEKIVLKSPLPVIVDFWAPWCGPCRMVAPILEKIAKEQDGKLIVAKVNTDEYSHWASKYGVQGIPTMLFIANGQVIHKQVGLLPESKMKEIVNLFLNSVAVAN